MVKLTFVSPSNLYVREIWDYNKANIENIKAVSNFNWNRAVEYLSVVEKFELLIFWNYIPNKKIKCNYRQPPWMTDNIKKSLKQRSKLTKIFYKNGQKNSDYIKVLEKSEECTSLIAEAKKNNILKMTYNLEDSNTASETYCPILNRFHYNKNTLQYHLYLLMVISFQIFARKSTFLISFFLLYAHL